MKHRLRIRPARWGVALTVLGATALSVALLAPTLVQSPTAIPGDFVLDAPLVALAGASAADAPGAAATRPAVRAGVGAQPPAASRVPTAGSSGSAAPVTPARTPPGTPGTVVYPTPRAPVAPTLGRPATTAATQAGTPASTRAPSATQTPVAAPAPSPTPAPVTVVTPDRPVVSGDDDGADDDGHDRSTRRTPAPTPPGSWGADG